MAELKMDDDLPIEEPFTVPTIVSRKEWGALPGGEQRLFKRPVEDVIYSYTETEACKTRDDCIKAMQTMQKAHIKNGMPDIRFNFVIGGDGNVYEGTGWNVRAPENEQYPDIGGRHIEFSHTGYRESFPTADKVKLINDLYEYGVSEKHIAADARTYIDYMWPTD